MPKRTSGRKKGIQRGIPKQRIGSKKVADGQDDKNNDTEAHQFLCFSRSKLSSFGKKTFNFMLASCEKFHLIGFKCTENGDFIPLSRRDQIWHYAAPGFCLVVSLHKTWGTVQVFLYEELRMGSFMCLSLTLVYVVAVLLAVGVVLRPKETMDLNNSWAYLSHSLQKIDSVSTFHPFDNIPTCLKVTFSFLVCQAISLTVALGSAILDDVPIFLYPMADRSGLLPDSILPNWAWKLTFVPLEWLVAQPFMLIAPFSASFLFMEHGLLDIYLRQLGNIKVRCMGSRRRVEQMYLQLELFNRIGQVWILVFFPPWLVALSAAAILSAFVTIRYTTQLPLIVYIFFPYTGATLILLIFWQSYDMFRTIRASENILGGLWQHEALYFRGMSREKRIEKMKRSKAMRPLVFSIADSEFSLNLPINTWDEILNQTLFLLSL